MKHETLIIKKPALMKFIKSSSMWQMKSSRTSNAVWRPCNDTTCTLMVINRSQLLLVKGEMVRNRNFFFYGLVAARLWYRTIHGAIFFSWTSFVLLDLHFFTFLPRNSFQINSYRTREFLFSEIAQQCFYYASAVHILRVLSLNTSYSDKLTLPFVAIKHFFNLFTKYLSGFH